MTTRNLTKQFIEIRSAAKANRSLRQDDSSDETDYSLLNKKQDTTNWSAVRDTLPPVWVDRIAQIDEAVAGIKTRIRDLNALHTKRLMVNFESDEASQEREIDYKTQEITRGFHEVESLVKKFGRVDDEKKMTDAEIKTRNNIQKSIAQRLQALSQSFRATQKEYMNKLNAQKNGSGSAAFQFLDEKKASTSTPIEDFGMTTSQIQVVDNLEEEINQRDEEIQKIAKSIEELASIFKELAVLVIDQGTILDRIDYNMETAVEHAKEGVKQLETANEHQKNAMPFRCIVVLVLLIAIMLSILVWKHSGKR